MTDPQQWDTTGPPSIGTLAEAAVSHIVHRRGDVWTATLVHMATSVQATARSHTRDDAVHAAWFALRRTLTEHPTIERTTTHE